jgi:hypothetical protein
MQADQWLRQELEGLSGEDREFEIARRYIRFAIDALQRALKAPPRVPGPVAAEIVVSEAARSHMPGIVPFVPELVGEASSVPRHRRSVMSTYEYQQGPYETEDEYGPFETGYETYEGEDEQFLGTLVGTIAKAVAPPLPGLAKGIFGALTSDGKGKGKGPLSATQEMELTAELLEITSEEELEEFLGNLFRGVAKTVGGVIGGPEGKALGGVLKGVAKQALPVVGALDGAVLPHAGGALGSLASDVFELELEGLTHEQAQFETGRSLVGLATTAAAHVAKTPPGAHPKKAVRAAMTKAARKHAPGLLSGAAGGPRGKQRRPRPGERPSPPAARRLGAAAFPDPDAADGASGHAGANGAAKAPADPSAAEPSFGAPEWDEPEPGDDAPDGGGARARSGRWIRRGGKILVLGV